MLADALETARRQPVRLVVNTPPQHGKSTLVFHWLAMMLRLAALRVIYITYSADFAMYQMRIAKPIAERAGVPFAGSSRAFCEWSTSLGGMLSATGIGGPITGKPGGIIVVDDPIKDWTDAQSPSVRETTYNWLRSSVLTRMHPSSSVIVVQTRWHVDDVSARLERDGWARVNLKAIQDDGSALWPEERPLPWLEVQRSEQGVGPLMFEALYQGNPRPREGSLFNGASYYEPGTEPQAMRHAIGVDLAYTAKTSAHASVSIVGGTEDGINVYVKDFARKQVKASDFALTLKAHSSLHPGSPMWWYCSTTERGSADLLKSLGIPITGLLATADKYVRAQAVAAAWNAGRVHLPKGAAWVPDFVRKVLNFTGIGDEHDDEIDALAAMFDALQSAGGMTETAPAKGVRAAFGIKGGVRSRF